MNEITAGLELISAAVRGLLDRARAIGSSGGDGAVVCEVRDGIVEVGRAAQALHGLLLTLVAEGDRLGVARGGMGPWLATVLDFTPGRARGLAEDARVLATVPEFEGQLCSGAVGQDSARAISRTVKAVRRTSLESAHEVAETWKLARSQGAKAGLDRVRALEEHVDPGSIEQRHAQARERSFGRIALTGDGGMHRCEILLDPARGAVLQAAVELQVAEMIRLRQFDGVGSVPDDVRTTEQMNAEAITRMAQVFLDAPAKQRGAHFSLPALAVTVQNSAAGPAEIPAGCARTVFGALVPAQVLPKRGDARRQELVVGGQTGTLDGVPVDRDPNARLATIEQRGFLTWRDRHCQFPGCDRPITFALHAHHETPYMKGGATSVNNLKLYCSEHHTAVHHG